MSNEPIHFSRRDLFTGKLFRSRAAPAPAREERVMPLLRPPGARPEMEFLKMCTQCGDCLVACPYRALFLAPARFRQAAGTPMFDPTQQPCWMCEDTPCITACKPLALRTDPGTFPRMGVARIQVYDCLAHQDTTCTSCVERCPSPGALVLETGRPRIIPDRCTGCGVCQHVCPAPRNAILLLPLERTEPPVSREA
jgi:MauM/NapG family ferredoxin protein